MSHKSQKKSQEKVEYILNSKNFKNTTYQNLWDACNEFFRGKVSAYIRKKKKGLKSMM